MRQHDIERKGWTGPRPPQPKAQKLLRRIGVDPDKLRERKRRYRERHLEAERERNKRWHQANRERAAQSQKEWRDAHPEAGVLGVKRWRQNNPEEFAQQRRADAANRRAREMGRPGRITRVDVAALWLRQPVCVNCGVGRGLDHIVEYWQGGDNVSSNLQNLCRACNVAKTARLRFVRAG